MFSCFKKPSKPRMRKAQSMHGRTRTDKVVQQQREVSLQEKLEKKVTVETVPNGGNGTVNKVDVDEVDHSAVVVRSKSPSQDLGGKTSPIDRSNPVENGEGSTLTTENLAEPVEPVTQPQSSTSSSAKGTYIINS